MKIRYNTFFENPARERNVRYHKEQCKERGNSDESKRRTGQARNNEQ
jgi:hypothetical protein